MLKEFKEFINRGGVFEAAVGLIMALAFAPVVTSVVDDLIMPIVARLVGQPDFSALQIGLGSEECTVDADGVETCVEAAIRYGAFINTVVSFALIGFVVFLLVKAYNKTQEPEVEEEAGPTEVELLTEIRDQLAR